MNFKPIVIVGGEPQSIFIEIFLKAIKKIDCPVVLISSKNIVNKNIKKFNSRFKINCLNKDFLNYKKGEINLIDVDYNKFSFSKKKITSRSNKFIQESFKQALKILKNKKCLGLINGPISKKNF